MFKNAKIIKTGTGDPNNVIVLFEKWVIIENDIENVVLYVGFYIVCCNKI